MDYYLFFSRWGKRHPWMYAAILPMAGFWIMLWHPPEAGSDWLYGYLLLFAFLVFRPGGLFAPPAGRD